jgi:hypothetical protein
MSRKKGSSQEERRRKYQIVRFVEKIMLAKVKRERKGKKIV